MATKFNDSLTMLCNLPSGTRFRKVDGKATYIKVSPWHARREGTSRIIRIVTITMVYAEAPSWSR